MKRKRARPGKRRTRAPAVADPRLLKELFTRNAYVRVANLTRRQEVGSRKYKKGYEVRFVVKTPDELEELRQALKAAGFSPARPFPKAKQIIQPVYGKQAVECFQRYRKPMVSPAGLEQ